MVGQHGDALGALAGPRQQRGLDGGAGHVARVHDAALAVAALAPELEVAGVVAVEGHPQGVGQVVDVGRTLTHADLDGVAVAQAIADAQRVFDVLLEGVARAQHAGHATLGVAGVGLGQRALRHHHHPAVGRGPQGKVEAGQARTKHQVVRFHTGRRVAGRASERECRTAASPGHTPAMRRRNRWWPGGARSKSGASQARSG